ncbi:MAG: permease [Helicobacteraceae bacterium]|nr:permease [Helicobacteraceae bacterium]
MKQQTKKRANYFGWFFLLAVAISYITLAFASPDKASQSLLHALDILKQVIPILAVVLFLTALLNTFVQPKSIAGHLGKESGIKGWLLALTGGLLSHGSTYIWYPILQDLRLNGARNGLIVAFFYARAIKLPWLPMMISYFGLTFTLTLSFYTLLGALFQGLIADKLLEKPKD